MFTLTQIHDAHAQVKIGGDFPAYVAALKELGVERYETFVLDGHTDYWGADGYRVSSPAQYPELTISAHGNATYLRERLLAHQADQTDYATFCSDMATAGVMLWEVNMQHLTCVYYGSGREVLMSEAISVLA